MKQNTSFERNKAEMRELFLNVKQYWVRKKYIKISGKHDVEVLKVPKSKKNNQRERKERSKEKMVASTRICRFYTMGKCKYGLKCRFLHVDDEEDLFFEDEDDEEEEKSMTGLTFLSASQNDTNQAEIKEQNDVENENQILDKIGQYINNGIKKFSEGQYPLALVIFTQGICELESANSMSIKSLEDYSFVLWIHRCETELHLKLWDKVLMSASKVIEIQPQCMVAFIHRGQAFQELGDIQRAVNDFARALVLNTNDKKAHEKLSHSLRLLESSSLSQEEEARKQEREEKIRQEKKAKRLEKRKMSKERKRAERLAREKAERLEREKEEEALRLEHQREKLAPVLILSREWDGPNVQDSNKDLDLKTLLNRFMMLAAEEPDLNAYLYMVNINDLEDGHVYTVNQSGSYLRFHYEERCICGNYGCVKDRTRHFDDVKESLSECYSRSGIRGGATFASVFFLKSAATNKHHVWSFLASYDDDDESGEEIIRVELLSQKQNIQWATSFGGADWFEKNMQLSDDIEIEFGGVRTKEDVKEVCQLYRQRCCRCLRSVDCAFNHTTKNGKTIEEDIFSRKLENEVLHSARLLDCFESMVKGNLIRKRRDEEYNKLYVSVRVRNIDVSSIYVENKFTRKCTHSRTIMLEHRYNSNDLEEGVDKAKRISSVHENSTSPSASLLGPRPDLITFLKERLTEQRVEGLTNYGVGILHPTHLRDIDDMDADALPSFRVEIDEEDESIIFTQLDHQETEDLMAVSLADSRFDNFMNICLNGYADHEYHQDEFLGVMKSHLSEFKSKDVDILRFLEAKFNLSVLYHHDNDAIKPFDVRFTAVLHLENDASITANEFNIHSNLRQNKMCLHTLSLGPIQESEGVCPCWFYCGDISSAEEGWCPFCEDDGNHFESYRGRGFTWKPLQKIDDCETDDSLPDLTCSDEEDSLPELVTSDEDADKDDGDADKDDEENASENEENKSDESVSMSFVEWWKTELPKNKKRYERSNDLWEMLKYEEALEESEDACDSIDAMLDAGLVMSPEETKEVNSLKQKLLLQSSCMSLVLVF